MRSQTGNIPYTGVPEVEPTFAPADYQRIQATPREFGAQVGEGMEAVGQGLQHASDIYSDIAAQQATTSWRKQVNALMFGDPSKPGDAGLYGLHGQAFMEAREGKLKQIEDVTTQTLGTLGTARSQILFNNEARYYQARIEGEVGRQYGEESKAWGETVNNDQYQNAVADAALRPQDEDAATHALAEANAARVRRLQVLGQLPMDISKATPEQLQIVDHETRQSSIDVLESRIHALVGRNDPASVTAARGLFEKNESLLSTSKNFDALARLTEAANDGAVAHRLAFGGSGINLRPETGAQALVTPEQVTAAAQKNEVDPALANATADIESSYGANLGRRGNVFQLGPAERASVGVFGFGTPEEQAAYGTQFLARKKQELTAAFGREPTNAEVYLAHQQGTDGAVKLLRQPNARAGDIVGDAAIRDNGGDPNAPALDFTTMWQDRYDRAEAKYTGGIGGGIHAGATIAPTVNRIAATDPGVLQTPGLYPKLLEIENDPTATPKQKNEGAELAAKIYNAQYTDETRAYELHQRAVKQASEDRSKQYQADVFSANPQMTAQQAANDPALTAEDQRRVIDFIKAGANPPVNPALSHHTVMGLVEDMRLPAGNPQRIGDTAPIDAAYGQGKLTREDYDFAMSKWDNLRAPDGTKLADVEREFVKGMQSSITKSNPLMGQLDHEGDQKFYQFNWAVNHAVGQYRKDGKNPFDLFDPAKPDYLGTPEAIRPYATSMQQSAAHMPDVLGLSVPAPTAQPGAPSGLIPPPALAAPPVAPRRQGESMGDWVARMHLGLPGAPASAPIPPIANP